MAAIYRYRADVINEDTGDILHEYGLVAADTYAKAVEEVVERFGGDELFISIEIYEIDNPADDGTLKAIFEDEEEDEYVF